MKFFAKTVLQHLRNLPLHRKLMAIAMVTSGNALLIAIFILSIHDVITLRSALQADVASTASVIAESSTAALSFQDPAVASQNLMALRQKPQIRAACLYDASGNLFSSYKRGDRISCPPRPDPRREGFMLHTVTVYRPVILAGKAIGTIYIESTLEDLRNRLKAQAMMFAIVLIISGFVAFLISSRLQRLISGPLLSLSRTAKAISRTNNFSLRASKETDDEVGHLVDAFNHMLEQISERDLQRADLLDREQQARSEAEDAARRSAFIAEVSRILSSSLDVRETVGKAARLAARTLQSWCVIDIEQKDGLLRFEAMDSDTSPHNTYTRLGGAWELHSNLPVASVMATGEPSSGEFSPELVHDEAGLSPERLAFIRSMKLKCFITVPLLSGTSVLGAISFAFPVAAKYSVKELHTIEQLANRLAVAVVSSNLYTELQKSDHLKDEFLATMSHELRTPLTSILGWSQLLKGATGATLTADKASQAIDIIDRNAKFETQLVDDILDASRIISGKLTMDFQPVDILEVLKSAIHSIGPSAAAKSLRIETHLNPSPCIRGNAYRLQQIFGNLLSNSIKFTPPHGTITVTLLNGRSSLEIQVSDTGAGISPDFIPHVFERFRQADASTTRKHGGLGLGLAIVRHLVELHGGKVVAESRGAGLGATFTVSLPMTAKEPVSVPEKPQELTPMSLSGVSALVVEDETDTRELIAQIIEQHGGTVQKADSYETAMAVLEQFTPDVLLIDIGMPVHSGYALIATARSKRPLQSTPAVAVTAYATDADRKAALAAGFQAHIAKPFDPGVLVRQIFDLVSPDVSHPQGANKETSFPQLQQFRA